jgi:GT2 family glycosyltransferase
VNSAPGERVVALVVSHDGARWLPSVITGLEGQRVRPGRVVAVDTGSKDASADLLERAFGSESVVRAPSSTSFPVAVGLGLDHSPDSEWVWILHDDANPAPDALAELLAAAEADPEADVLGPKLREWPSL